MEELISPAVLLELMLQLMESVEQRLLIMHTTLRHILELSAVLELLLLLLLLSQLRVLQFRGLAVEAMGEVIFLVVLQGLIH
jgi:hypothetical protein